ncbi:MAG: tetratricopeptide repeat protein, partial [Phycisphaerales bacterium]|nr:tetratricopeptide repeat protein [Phycisphaerales bacterium]
PGIATIYESGRATIDGMRRPYFAMEFVDGHPLDVYAERLTLRERVRMIADICDAIEHAHLRGVLHRDLKPANIIVGDDHRARVLDFGVATSVDTEQRASELVGTVPYMSPEQLSSDPDVDCRSDIYALGVVLCEILTGERPHDLSGMTIDEALERVLMPPRMNTGLLGGELEMIVRKAIAPAKEDRYGSASMLAADLRRYLGRFPVLAVGGGAVYRARKYVQRNRVPVLLGTLAGVLAIGGVVGVSYQAARATRGWHRAEEETARAESALEQAIARHRWADSMNHFMIDMLVSADPESTLGEQVTVVEMLDTASSTLESEPVEYPETVAGIRMAMANTYRGLGRLDDALHHARSMVELCTTRLGAGHPMTADARRTLALILFEFAEFDEAKENLDAASSVIVELNDPVESAKLKAEYARVAHGSGDHSRALELWTQSERELADLLGTFHKETLVVMHNRGMALKDLGRLSESEAVMREVLARRLEAFGPDHPQTLVAEDVLAGVIQKQGRDAEASVMLREVVERRRRVLGDDHISTLVSMGNLGVTLIRLGELDEAELLTREAYDGHLARFGEENARTQILLGNFAYLLEDRGQIEEAAELYRKSIDIRRRSAGGLDPETWATMNNLAMLLMSSGKPEEAGPLFDELLAMCDSSLPADHYYTALFRNNQGECLTMLGKYAEARSALLRSHPVLVRTFGEEHTRTTKSQSRIDRLNELDPQPER